MIDLSKLGGPSAPGGSSSVQSQPNVPGGTAPPDFGPVLTPREDPANPVGEMPWDTLGRQLWGTPEEGGTQLGRLPVIGDIGRGVGDLFNVGAGAIVGAGAAVLGSIPTGGINEQPNASIKLVDRYSGTPSDAVKMLQDMKAQNANLPAQFMLLGHWQQLHDPEAVKDWQAALAEANTHTDFGGGHAGDTINNYIRKWGTTYADMTPNGLSGLYDVMPEMAFGTGGSVGQSFSDSLSNLMILQRKAERGFASIKGAPQALLAGTPENIGRIRDLRAEASRGHELSPIEKATLQGIDELGWSDMHALNFLLAHGQGYSADGPTQFALAIGLDPLNMASLGATEAATIGGRAALYANTAESASRAVNLYRGVAQRIGTTVEATRASDLGPAFKIARTIIDPISSLGGGTKQVAMVDVWASAGLQATKRAYGYGAFTSARRLASQWGMKEAFDSSFAVASVNYARKWVGITHIDNLLKLGDVSPRYVMTDETIGALGRSQPKDAVTRMAAYVTRHKAFYLSSAGRDQLAERMAKMGNQTIDVAKAAVSKMSDDERALWHSNTYFDTWSKYKDAVTRVPREQWGKLESKVEDMVVLNPSQLDRLSAEELQAALETAAPEARPALWNTAADQFSAIEDLGRVEPGQSALMSRRIAALDKMIQEGHLHMALTDQEIGRASCRERVYRSV